MNNAFYYTIIILILTRLIFQWDEKTISRKHTIRKFFIELVLMLPVIWIENFPFLLIILLSLNLSSFYTEQKWKGNSLSRFVIFWFHFMLVLVVSSHREIVYEANFTTKNILNGIVNDVKVFQYSFPFSTNQVLGTITGMMLLMNEVNHLIRFVLKRLKIDPQRKESSAIRMVEKRDMNEFNRGRVIGILERILIFLLALNGHVNAIGFILTAKGLARYREIADRNFAEYLIIGTLLSALLALLAGILFQHILGLGEII